MRCITPSNRGKATLNMAVAMGMIMSLGEMSIVAINVFVNVLIRPDEIKV